MNPPCFWQMIISRWHPQYTFLLSLPYRDSISYIYLHNKHPFVHCRLQASDSLFRTLPKRHPSWTSIPPYTPWNFLTPIHSLGTAVQHVGVKRCVQRDIARAIIHCGQVLESLSKLPKEEEAVRQGVALVWQVHIVSFGVFACRPLRPWKG